MIRRSRGGPDRGGEPLRIDVTELRRDLGSRLDVHRSVALEDVSVVDSRVPAGGVLDIDLVLDAVTDGVVAAGMITVPWEGRCRRCLEPVSGVATHRVQEAFTHDGDGDTYVLDGDELDLEPLARDAAVLGLPLAPLCGDECRGPDPDRFPARSPEQAASDPDPRWAVLDELDLDDGDPH